MTSVKPPVGSTPENHPRPDLERAHSIAFDDWMEQLTEQEAIEETFDVASEEEAQR